LFNLQEGTYDLNAVANNNAKGFPALDYLLFSKANLASQYVLFSTDANAGRRTQMVLDITNAMLTRVNAVCSGWDTYLNVFVNATGTDVGSGTGLLVNQLNFDWEILRRNKIGDPIGVRFLGEIKPYQAEGYFCGLSKELALANGRGIHRIFNGNRLSDNQPGVGFDDYLIAIDAQAASGPLAQAVENQFQLSFSSLQALPSSIAQSAVANTNLVQATYNEHQKVIVLLKNDVPSALGVLITYNSNDGD
jgi:hypothetical protein